MNMDKLKEIREFIKRGKIYVWLIIFILTVNSVMFFVKPHEEVIKELGIRKAKEQILKEEYALTPEKVELLVREKKEIVVAMNLFILLAIFLLILGLIMDFFLFFYRPKEITFLKGPALEINWDIWDVCKAVILFLFFGYILIIIESVFARIFPLIKEREHVRIMINSSILDTLVIIFVLHLILVEYKNKIKSIGLCLGSFFKNVFIGIAGYISALPLIIGSLAFVILIARLINYEPPFDPILRLFLEEKGTLFLLYSTVFVTIFGPIFEEIFFRGFMYGAIRKKVGIIGAIIVSSILFSLLHTNIIGFLPIMLLGALLAYLYEKTGSLIPSIIVHIIHNTGMMVMVFLMKEIKI